MEYDVHMKYSLLVKDKHLLYDPTLDDIQRNQNDAMRLWLEELKLARRDRDKTYQSPKNETPTGLRLWMLKRKR